MDDEIINVLIADDHQLYLEGLKCYFETSRTYRIVGTAVNGEDLLSKAALLKPHIVLTDVRMPVVSGTEAIRELAKRSPGIRCIVLTSYDNDLAIIEALEAGAKGYITKNMPRKDLFTALDDVCRGYQYFCRTTSSKMIRMLGKSSFNPYGKANRIQFSDSEKAIIRLICEDRDNREIAARLNMSVRTVENIRSRILKKINVRTTAGVAVYALKNGLYFLGE